MRLTIKHLVNAVPLMLLAMLGIAFGIAWYYDAAGETIRRQEELAKVASRPVMNLIKSATGGGNYAAIQNSETISLFQASEKLRFLEVRGKTDVSGSAFGLIYDAASGKVVRTQYPANYREELASRLSKGTEMLQRLVAEDSNRGRIDAIVKETAAQLAVLDESAAAQKMLSVRFGRPDADTFENGFSIDHASGLLHMNAATGNSGGGEVWMVFDASEITGLWYKVVSRILPVAVLGILFSIAATMWLSNRIVPPLQSMTQTMSALARRDFQVVIAGKDRADELGAMAKALEVFREGMLQADQLATERELDRAAREKRSEQIAGLVSNFSDQIKHMIDALSTGSCTLDETARSMSTTAEMTHHRAETVTIAAGEANGSVTTVSQAAQKLQGLITDIQQQVEISSEIASQAVRDAHVTDGIMKALSDGAQRIGDIVGLISTIAGQTNLLALNATIEAARAGEAGRGFAVVASEVKALAQQTAKATEEISAQVCAIQSTAKQAVEAITNTSHVITNLSEGAEAIALAISQQREATGEIARCVLAASDSTHKVTSNIEDVHRSAADAGSAAAQVLNKAEELSRHSTSLANEVNRFLNGVKAA